MLPDITASESTRDRRDQGEQTPVADRYAPLRRLFANRYLTLVSRLVLGLVFLLAGLTKLGADRAFLLDIRSYQLPLPDLLAQAVAVALPPIEVGLGICLVLGFCTRFAAAVSSGLMLVFLLALLQAWLRGLSPECGCFSDGPGANPLGSALIGALGPLGTFLTSGRVGPGTVLRDLSFLLMGWHLLRVPTVLAVDGWLARRGAEDAADSAD